MKSDPKNHFQYPACLTCFETPCGTFLFHQSYDDIFLFVHNAQYNTLNPCLFAAPSFDEVTALMRDCDIAEIDARIRGLMAQMTPDELLLVDKEHCIESYLDRAGRMEYLRRLWEEKVFSVIRVPQHQAQDEKMRAWFKQ
jgi:hypothetical protein